MVKGIGPPGQRVRQQGNSLSAVAVESWEVRNRAPPPPMKNDGGPRPGATRLLAIKGRSQEGGQPAQGSAGWGVGPASFTQLAPRDPAAAGMGWETALHAPCSSEPDPLLGHLLDTGDHRGPQSCEGPAGCAAGRHHALLPDGRYCSGTTCEQRESSCVHLDRAGSPRVSSWVPWLGCPAAEQWLQVHVTQEAPGE